MQNPSAPKKNISLISTLDQLIARARSNKHRGCLILSGSASWAYDQATQIAEYLRGNKQSFLWISSNAPDDVTSIESAKSRSLLGSECGHVIFDSFSGFNPDSLGAVTGSITAGNILILLVPELDKWHEFDDPESSRIAVYPYSPSQITQRYLARLAKINTELSESNDQIILIKETHTIETSSHQEQPQTDASIATIDNSDQLNAIAAIEKVALGRRRRPLVITADRGRGKSAAMGLAAKQLITDKPLRIIVTAPRKDASNILFQHADHSDQLKFIAPDELCQTLPECDLLLVDEAAGIPSPLLTQLLRHYARIVFASTIHGYEGTGRGFAIRFKRSLDEITPSWKQLTLEAPIRWAKHDPVEKLSNRMLLLDATETDSLSLKFSTETKKADTSSNDFKFVQLDRDQLWQNENLLSTLFGLLINAHYQTKPIDLRHLLDGPNMQVHALFKKSELIGVVLLAIEGDLHDEIITAIQSGKRRPPGHLIPETLITTYGNSTLSKVRGGRIVRIAIHPDHQRQGLGLFCLNQLEDSARDNNLSYLSSSFGAHLDLLRFWEHADFIPVRIGTQRNANSGEYSFVLIKSLSKICSDQTVLLQNVMCDQLPQQLAQPLAHMEPSLVAWLLRQTKDRYTLEENDRLSVFAFSNEQRSYESVLTSLHRWALWFVSNAVKGQSSPIETELPIMKLLQHQSWQTVCQLLDLSGKKQALFQLQNTVRKSLS